MNSNLEECMVINRSEDCKNDAVDGSIYCKEHGGKQSLVYVGSSWKNLELLDLIHNELHRQNVDTWDFRKNGFWWKELDNKYNNGNKMNLDDFIQTREAIKAYRYDKEGLDKADLGLFILPAGISTAAELGYMAGTRKMTILAGEPREDTRDIMWLFSNLRYIKIPLDSAGIKQVCSVAASLAKEFKKSFERSHHNNSLFHVMKLFDGSKEEDKKKDDMKS